MDVANAGAPYVHPRLSAFGAKRTSVAPLQRSTQGVRIDTFIAFALVNSLRLEPSVKSGTLPTQ